MAEITPLLRKILGNGGYWTSSIDELFLLLEIDTADLLGALETLKGLLEDHELDIKPPVSKGDFWETRVIEPFVKPKVDLEKLVREGEGQYLEFKESAFADKKKMQFKPDAPKTELRSDGVELAALKTLAAFSNTEGGQLLVGVSDSGEVKGIESDWAVLGIANCDEWELRFGQLVESRFHKGKKFQSFYSVEFVEHERGTVALIDVKPTRSIDLVKKGNDWLLFLRQGNKTIKLEWVDLEDFYELERKV